MTKAHSRTDLQYRVIRGSPRFSRVAYACVITQETAYHDKRAIYHIETFYGENGVKERAAARAYGSAICRGKRRVAGFREQYLPSGFPGEGLPKMEKDIQIR